MISNFRPKLIHLCSSIHADFLIAAPGKVAFEVSDFFKYTVPSESRFDLIFDYLLVPVSYAAVLRIL